MKPPYALFRAPRLRVSREVEMEIGGREVLQTLCSQWGLKPFRRFKGFVFYSQEDLEAARNRQQCGDGGN